MPLIQEEGRLVPLCTSNDLEFAGTTHLELHALPVYTRSAGALERLLCELNLWLVLVHQGATGATTATKASMRPAMEGALVTKMERAEMEAAILEIEALDAPVLHDWTTAQFGRLHPHDY